MKKYLIAGLLVWAPLGITIWVLDLLISTMDQTLLLLPETWRPEQWLGMRVPGLGLVLGFFVLLLTGVFAANVIGERLIRFWEGLLARIPVVKSIYYSVKQVSDTLFSSKGVAFRKALLIQYPRQGAWTIAFLTGKPGGDVANHLAGDYVSVYVPTTPNPTSGFFLMVPRSDVVELDMSVDAALKYIVSMGVVAPESRLPAANGRVAERPPEQRVA